MISDSKSLILSYEKIFRILKRISVQIYENNMNADPLVLVGIYDQGYKMAEYIQGELKLIDPKFKTSLIELKLDKSNPASDISMDSSIEALSEKSIVLVDDVLNTSRTLAYALKFLLQVPLQSMEVAVLINRSHASFPVSPNYSGYELATTLDEHIEVKLEGEIGAYLF